LEELRLQVGDLQLPDPDQFGRLVADLLTAEESAGRAQNAAAAEKLEVLRNSSPEALEGLQAGLVAIEELAVRAVRVLGDLTETILTDLLVGNVDRWTRLRRTRALCCTQRTHCEDGLGRPGLRCPPMCTETACEQMLNDAESISSKAGTGGSSFSLHAWSRRPGTLWSGASLTARSPGNSCASQGLWTFFNSARPLAHSNDCGLPL
jgi:hypothetical protein